MGIMLALSCSSRIEMKEEIALIEQTMGSFFQAIEDEDVSLLATVMSTEDGIENIGLISEGKIQGWKSYRERAAVFFSHTQSVEFFVREMATTLHHTGSIAWVSGIVDATVTEPEKEKAGIWFTAVLEKRGHRWILFQTHFAGVLVD